MAQGNPRLPMNRSNAARKQGVDTEESNSRCIAFTDIYTKIAKYAFTIGEFLRGPDYNKKGPARSTPTFRKARPRAKREAGKSAIIGC